MLDALAPSIVALVAVISGVLTAILYVGFRRSRNRKILFIVWALFTHFVKSAVVAVALQWSLMGHETLEVFEAVLDLIMVLFLFIPFMLRD